MQKLILSHNLRASKIMKNFPELKYHKELTFNTIKSWGRKKKKNP